jgi:hypothetical protein
MTRRQQLFLFVLGLTATSLCITGAALAMDTLRRASHAAPVVVAQAPPPTIEETVPAQGLAWSSPPPSPTDIPSPTPTYTLVPTWTPEATDTPTVAPTPTETPLPPTATPQPRPPASPATPEPPTATPAPLFKFTGNYVSFDTGAPEMTRITGMIWKIIDVNTSQFEAEPNYQMKLVDPAGEVHMSDISGLGGADSTCPRCGDNRRMNCKVEFAPYLPGVYHVTLIQAWDGGQAAAEIEFTLAATPQQYVHIDFFPNQ